MLSDTIKFAISELACTMHKAGSRRDEFMLVLRELGFTHTYDEAFAAAYWTRLEGGFA